MDQKVNSNQEEIHRYGVILGGIEVGLGSLLHLFHVPLRGHLLSINQGFILSYALRKNRNKRGPFIISNLAALLKSLSPAGGKLGPMFSLSIQGILFNCGVLGLGANVVGATLGMVLLSTWAFIYPVVTYYLLFGKTFFYALNEVFIKASELIHFDKKDLWFILAGLITAKGLLSALFSILAFQLPEQSMENYQKWMIRFGEKSKLSWARTLPSTPLSTPLDIQAKNQKSDPIEDQANFSSIPKKNALSNALRDLLNPFFILSFLLTLVFAYYAERDHSKMIWIALRPLAVSFLLFCFARSSWGQSFFRKARGAHGQVPK